MTDIKFENKQNEEKVSNPLKDKKFQEYYMENTKELFSFAWKDIENHLSNLIEYYSYLAEKTGHRVYNQRLIKVILGRDMLLNKNKEPDTIYLTQLDLYFLEWHQREEIANLVQNKELIDLEEKHYPKCSEIIIED